MRDLHALAAPILLVGLAALAIAAATLLVLGRGPDAVEWVRRLILGVLVAEAGIGLALAIRGSGPAEWIHWLYGPAIIAVLMVPASLELPPRRRSGALAVGSLLAVALTWRLWASG